MLAYRTLIWIFVLQLLCAKLVISDITIEFRLRKIVNDRGMLYPLSSRNKPVCDPEPPASACDYGFQMKITFENDSLIQIKSISNNDIMPGRSFLDTNSINFEDVGLSGGLPFKFILKEKLNSFVVSLRIMDEDGSSSQNVGILKFKVPQIPLSKIDDHHPLFIGCSVGYSLEVKCAQNYSGPSCACFSRNDENVGYSCDSLGHKSCLPGFIGENCDQRATSTITTTTTTTRSSITSRMKSTVHILNISKISAEKSSQYKEFETRSNPPRLAFVPFENNEIGEDMSATTAMSDVTSGTHWHALVAVVVIVFVALLLISIMGVKLFCSRWQSRKIKLNRAAETPGQVFLIPNNTREDYDYSYTRPQPKPAHISDFFYSGIATPQTSQNQDQEQGIQDYFNLKPSDSTKDRHLESIEGQSKRQLPIGVPSTNTLSDYITPNISARGEPDNMNDGYDGTMPQGFEDSEEPFEGESEQDDARELEPYTDYDMVATPGFAGDVRGPTNQAGLELYEKFDIKRKPPVNIFQKGSGTSTRSCSAKQIFHKQNSYMDRNEFFRGTMDQ